MTDVVAEPVARNEYPELTDEAIEVARGLIGVRLRRRVRNTTASRDLLLRWAKALGSRNPLYADAMHGVLNTHWASQLGHPSAIFAFDHTVVAPSLPGIHTIYGGAEIAWHRQIRAGDTIVAEARLEEVDELEGEFAGRMVRQTSRVEYRDGRGEPVATVRPTVLRTSRNAARRRGKYDGRKRHHYEADEMEAILDAYRDEEIRGTTPRYSEDVAVGDVLPTVVKAPLTTEDMNFFVSEVAETLAFSEFVAHLRIHPADVYWHEDKNMPDTWDASLVLDKVAREFGFPCAHDTGLQRICWLENLVTNWMGDLAMLRRLDVRLTAPFLHADTAWLDGRVSETRIEGDRALATLELRAHNQRRELVARGGAEVELPSRSFDVRQPGLIL